MGEDETGMPQASIRVSGTATPKEVAAIVAVLLSGSCGGGGDETEGPRAGGWADHARAIRGEVGHGCGAWRASALPR